jgi:cell division transport system ATP-binding protein
VIDFEGVSFAYRDSQVLDNVTVSLEPGAFHVLTGPSGAGKTTFLNLCRLALRPGSGRLRVFGEDAAGLDRDRVAETRRRIGVMDQDCRFLDHLSLRENVLLPLKLAGRMSAAAEADVDDLLAWTGLAARAGARPPELSGGERQRGALARAVILSPDIVLADEPTGNIDRDMGQRVLDLLVGLNRLGRTVLVATHDLELIRRARAEVGLRLLRLSDRAVRVAGAEA